jgi:hypothetical protein
MAVTPLTADELVGALDLLDVHFLSGGRSTPRAREVNPANLLAGLASQADARMRLAIIPLLLRHPEYGVMIRDALTQLPENAQNTLKLLYTAARLLQWKYHATLSELLGNQPILPDLFSGELRLSGEAGPQRQLVQLGERHAEMSGLSLNWVGTYEHAAGRFIARLHHQQTWAHQQVM